MCIVHKHQCMGRLRLKISGTLAHRTRMYDIKKADVIMKARATIDQPMDFYKKNILYIEVHIENLNAIFLENNRENSLFSLS